MNNTSLTNLFVYWKWMQTLQAFSPEYHKRLEVINKKVLFSDWHARVESPHYTASCIRHTDLIVEPVALTGSWYSTTDEQSCSIAAQCTRLWCLLCQVAGGGDTGDDAGQGRVFAGSALPYSPLTNRATHCCSGQRKKQSHSLASFKHETIVGQMGWGGHVLGIGKHYSKFLLILVRCDKMIKYELPVKVLFSFKACHAWCIANHKFSLAPELFRWQCLPFAWMQYFGFTIMKHFSIFQKSGEKNNIYTI